MLRHKFLAMTLKVNFEAATKTLTSAKYIIKHIPVFPISTHTNAYL